MQVRPRMLPISLFIESRRHMSDENCGDAVKAPKHASPPCLSIGIRDSQTFNSYCPETDRESCGVVAQSGGCDSKSSDYKRQGNCDVGRHNDK
jgi:hypothetical protein